jgi:hypothetical protein
MNVVPHLGFAHNARVEVFAVTNLLGYYTTTIKTFVRPHPKGQHLVEQIQVLLKVLGTILQNFLRP